MKKDTIADIATAMSNSGIGIVRISGAESINIVKKIYKGKKLTDHAIHYGFIKDGEEMIDEVLVMVMNGPHSFTGEDTVEINCHGGVYVVKGGKKHGSVAEICNNDKTGYKRCNVSQKWSGWTE